MSTSTRRSSRRAAAKHATTNTTVEESMTIRHSEKTDTTVLTSDARFPIPENEHIPLDSFDPAKQNDSDNVRGRVLRRQTVSPSQKLTDDVNVTEISGGNNKVPSTSRKREGTVSPDASNSNNTSEQDFDHQGNELKSKKSRKAVTFDDTEANVTAANSESDNSNSKRFRTAAQLAREQRSRRRQAAQGTDVPEASVGVPVSRKPDNRITHKKKVLGSSSNSTETDANVVRVPMLTGTLVLYRGSHPRAVFIRRV